MAAQKEDEFNERLTQLESQLAFQEDEIASLNQLVTSHNDELQMLQRKMALLIEKFQQIQERGNDDSQDPAAEIPPHY
ncbi:SlyX protein [Pseudidiomarina aestuarii]|uniref:Protein SlyX homolog n=1 Tax=Pseudidiomarina aestuarii TaxID=624146 RepID=A0A2T4CTL7_9GAMM|nr:SlyX protein [Pseudidiomarina aestuarii]PTB89131.1 SlyX protein [Pseudidiomarina aestuarii]